MKRVAASNSTANATAIESLCNFLISTESEKQSKTYSFLLAIFAIASMNVLKRSSCQRNAPAPPTNRKLKNVWACMHNAILHCANHNHTMQLFLDAIRLPRQVNSCRRLSHELSAAALRLSPEGWGNVNTTIDCPLLLRRLSSKSITSATQ